MKFDIFCSLSGNPRPAAGYVAHDVLLAEFLDQAIQADLLGYECIWVAESHYSSEEQKKHAQPVIPYWQGEVAINTDFFQLATHVLNKTKNISVGSAILNIISAGGPIVAAERLASLIAWNKGLLDNHRKINLGFSSGRFEYVNSTSGVNPLNNVEKTFWNKSKSAIFSEAAEIFLRMISGQSFSSDDIHVRNIVFPDGKNYLVEKRWKFETTKIVPYADHQCVDLIVGSHDNDLQKYLNTILPVKVFNLSITSDEHINKTHEHMRKFYHPDGGKWKREYMPRTVMVFLNEDPDLPSDSARRSAANAHAEVALKAYWQAMDGTIDNDKLKTSIGNAVVGTAHDVASQLIERFHVDDRIMLWFDFFSPDNEYVLKSMESFTKKVIPKVRDMMMNKRLEAELR